MKDLVEKFDAKMLDQQVNWLNELLAKLIGSNPEVKLAFKNHFDSCKANDYDDYVKKFNLETWCGGEMNPSVEIVQVKDELKFAMTHYGVLGPLGLADCNKPSVKEVIMDFLINPSKYLDKKLQETSVEQLKTEKS